MLRRLLAHTFICIVELLQRPGRGQDFDFPLMSRRQRFKASRQDRQFLYQLPLRQTYLFPPLYVFPCGHTKRLAVYRRLAR